MSRGFILMSSWLPSEPDAYAPPAGNGKKTKKKGKKPLQNADGSFPDPSSSSVGLGSHVPGQPWGWSSSWESAQETGSQTPTRVPAAAGVPVSQGEGSARQSGQSYKKGSGRKRGVSRDTQDVVSCETTPSRDTLSDKRRVL